MAAVTVTPVRDIRTELQSTPVCDRTETRRRASAKPKLITDVAASRLHGGRHAKRNNLPVAAAQTCSGLKPDDVGSYLPTVSKLDSDGDDDTLLFVLSKHAMQIHN